MRAAAHLIGILEPLAHFRREKIAIRWFLRIGAHPRSRAMAQYYEDARTLAKLLTEWPASHQQHVPVRGLLRRRPGHMEALTEGRTKRRQTVGLNIGCRSNSSQPLHHAGTELRVPLLLHAEVLLRTCLRSGGVPAARHAGRNDGNHDAHADAETRKKITVVVYGKNTGRKLSTSTRCEARHDHRGPGSVPFRGRSSDGL